MGLGPQDQLNGGERVQTFLRDERGELLERVDGVKWVVSGRDGDSIRLSVDGGVGYIIES